MDLFLGEMRWGLSRGTLGLKWGTAVSASDAWRSAVAALTSKNRVSVRVWLGGALARPFVLPAMAGLSRIQDAEKVAARLAPDETGLPGPCCVTLENWSPNRQTLCVAMSETLRAEIEGTDRSQLRVRSIRPWWTLVLDDALAAEPSIALLSADDGESFVVLGGTSDAFELASSDVPPPDEEQRKAMVRRSMIGGIDSKAIRHAQLQLSEKAKAVSTKPGGRTFEWFWQPAA